MTIMLKQSDFEQMAEHAKAGIPNEACGLIAGKIDGDIKYIEKVYLLNNPDESPEHFSVDPKEQLAAIKDMRQNGFVPLGNFHSHPNTPARPSEEDIRLAYDPKAIYLILSLADGKPVIKAFAILNSVVTNDDLTIMQN